MFDIPKVTEPAVYIITREQKLQMYDEEYKRLMEFPKERLVEMIIGKRYEVGRSMFGLHKK